jgi:hypothetical protein
MLTHRRGGAPLRGMLVKRLSLVGALGTPWNFLKFFLFFEETFFSYIHTF